MVKVIYALLGFQRDFWSEIEDNDSIVKSIEVMLKESENRIVSKLMTGAADSENTTCYIQHALHNIFSRELADCKELRVCSHVKSYDFRDCRCCQLPVETF